MPLDNAQYIKDLNANSPNGAIDKVKSLDDFIRETKRAVIQSFPNIGGAVKYSHTQLNDMRDNFSHEVGATEWDFQGNALTNIISKEDDDSAQPRIYNDKRYLQISNNLSELADMDADDLFDNLFTEALMLKLETSIFEKQYPIGHLLFNAQDARNPSVYLKFGVWEAYGAGRVITGHGSTIDTRGITRSLVAGGVGGEFQHTLTVDELPKHNHHLPAGGGSDGPREALSVDSGSWESNAMDWKGEGAANEARTDSTGKNQAFNVMQPYVVVYVWRRIG